MTLIEHAVRTCNIGAKGNKSQCSPKIQIHTLVLIGGVKNNQTMRYSFEQAKELTRNCE